MDSAEVVAQRIASGQYDDDGLFELVKVITAAIGRSELALRWVIRLPGGEEFRAGDVKPSEAVLIERALGLDWSRVHPGRSAHQLAEVLVVLFVSRLGLTEEQAREKLDSYTMEQLEEVVDVYRATPTRPAE